MENQKVIKKLSKCFVGNSSLKKKRSFGALNAENLKVLDLVNKNKRSSLSN